MKHGFVVGVAVLLTPVLVGLATQEQSGRRKDEAGAVSFKNDVMPVLEKYCLPCHAEENENKSKLSLDSYALLMEGGKHGVAVMPGEPEESILIQKVQDDPPFGDRMPLQSRRKKAEGPPKKLTVEELSTLSQWVAQGAKDN